MDNTMTKAERQRKFTLEKYHWYVDHGICPRCGCRDAYEPHRLCKPCWKKRQEELKSYDPDGSKAVAKSKAYQEKMRREHRCVDCGGDLPKDDNHTRCFKCRERRREWQQVYRIRKRLKQRGDYI